MREWADRRSSPSFEVPTGEVLRHLMNVSSTFKTCRPRSMWQCASMSANMPDIVNSPFAADGLQSLETVCKR